MPPPSTQLSPPKPDAAQPLSFMHRLSPSVSYFTPQEDEEAGRRRGHTSRDPELIIVLAWMGARDAHIAKYIAQHRALFPSSAILLVRSPATHVLWPPLASRHLRPAIPFLKGLAKPSSSAERIGHASVLRQVPRVLVHAFSNGGMFSAVKMASLLRAATRGQDLVLPRYVLLMDSCPGNFHWMRTHSAFLQSLPRWSSPLLHLALLFAWLCYKLRLMYPAQNRNADLFREAALVPLEVSRTYLYGSADLVIDQRDIEEHANRAAKTGFLVRREKFEGAGHVMNARADGDRYWRIVRETWEGKVGTSRT
ncbi:hypothetical protein PT974_10147 [Cladobotryum mycophilum]|uniref:Indole-diterpene biosynthesis protein PaxU n=1 Tax=Cladobotryum mycophilum TaxID=491253 RepID=A0ABR0S923_9HYPO